MLSGTYVVKWKLKISKSADQSSKTCHVHERKHAFEAHFDHFIILHWFEELTPKTNDTSSSSSSNVRLQSSSHETNASAQLVSVILYRVIGEG